MSQKKILFIRFSSFGDVVQSLSIPGALKRDLEPQTEIHWVTREDMAPLGSEHPAINKIWTLNRKLGLPGLIRLGLSLRQQKFTHIYDAHNNLRSRLLCWILRPLGLGPQLLRRSIRRWKRFLLFRFRINQFELPFSGQRDLLEPLQAWGVSKTAPPVPQLFVSHSHREKALARLGEFKGCIALAPSAAYFLKRWPKNHWQKLIELLPEQRFVLLGGPEDQFIDDIASIAPTRTLNLAGKCSLLESAAVVEQSPLLVVNDTGLLHVAEQLGKRCLAFMGPAPFGFPSRPQTKVLEKNLACRPCSKHGKGPCRNKAYFHECLVSISPEEVATLIREMMR